MYLHSNEDLVFANENIYFAARFFISVAKECDIAEHIATNERSAHRARERRDASCIMHGEITAR